MSARGWDSVRTSLVRMLPLAYMEEFQNYKIGEIAWRKGNYVAYRGDSNSTNRDVILKRSKRATDKHFFEIDPARLGRDYQVPNALDDVSLRSCLEHHLRCSESKGVFETVNGKLLTAEGCEGVSADQPSPHCQVNLP